MIKSIEKIVWAHCFISCRFITYKWVKKVELIFVTFSSYHVTYLNNHLTLEFVKFSLFVCFCLFKEVVFVVKNNNNSLSKKFATFWYNLFRLWIFLISQGVILYFFFFSNKLDWKCRFRNSGISSWVMRRIIQEGSLRDRVYNFEKNHQKFLQKSSKNQQMSRKKRCFFIH